MAKACGVSIAAVRHWVELGIPKTKTDKRVSFDVGMVTQWLVANRKAKFAARLTGCGAAGVGVTKSKHAKPDTMREMCERAKLVERFCFAVLEKKQADDAADVSYWLEYYARAAEQRRKIEKDLASVMLSQGEVVPKEQVEDEMRQMAQAIKQGLLAIPNSVAPRLAGKTAVEIAEELRREVTDVLRHLSGGKT